MLQKCHTAYLRCHNLMSNVVRMNFAVYVCSQSSNSFVVVTSKANDSYSGRNLTIVVLFSGGVLYALQDTVTFQYAGNPLITDIQPREIPIWLASSIRSIS